MTAKEAYDLVTKFLGKKQGVAICRDYDDYFGFYMLPPGAKKGDKVFVGGQMIIADKNTKRVFWQDDDDTVNLRGKFWEPVDGKDLGLDAFAHSYMG